MTAPPGNPRRQLRVLIIEDSEDDAWLNVTVLEAAGYSVHWQRVQDRNEMTRALAQTRWDVVLCDHALPRFDSFEALETLATSRTPDTPLIVVSGAIGEETAAAVIRGGAADYVNKKSLAGLPAVIAAVLRDARNCRAAADAAAQFRSAFDDAAFGSALVKLGRQPGRLLRVNKSLCDMIGMSRADLKRTTLQALVGTDERRGLELALGALSERRTSVFRAELRCPNATGDTCWFLVSLSAVRDSSPERTRAVAQFIDITIRKQAERDAARFTAVVENSHDAIIAKDLDGTVTCWNPGAEQLYLYSEDEMLGKSLSVLIPAGHDDELPSLLQRIAAGELIKDFETVRQRKDGTRISVAVTISPIRDAHGTIIGATTIARDISARLRHEQQLRVASEEDSLTGLCNRRRFERDLKDQIARSHRYPEPAAVLILDLNHFKQINDSYGHKAGDEALKHVATVLTQRLRQTDVIARIGGDEFAVLMAHVDQRQTEAVVDDLRRAILESTIELETGDTATLSVSIGAAPIDKHTTSDDAALADADRAMYEDKLRLRSTPGARPAQSGRALERSAPAQAQ
jgi:diguanylate cyclase (GGDEF)-like protein/PAS domain S-box-containing protein